METKLLVSGSELLKDYDLPIIIKNTLLLSPGIWNNVKYTGKEIKDAYLNTDWHNKTNTSLFLDHQDTKEAGVGNWVGYVKNAKVVGDELRGDLVVWNPLLALYLQKAKAKFGISATLKGLENKDKNKMQDFHFESFSIVTRPACKEAFINLSEKEGKGFKIITYPHIQSENKLQGGKMTEVKELQEEEKKEEEAKKETEATEKKKEAETEAESEETEESTEEETEEKSEELAKKKKYPYPYKEKKKSEMKKKKKKPEDEEEVSDSELEEITTNSAWTDFVKKMKKKYPDMSFKDIAKAFKQKSKKQEELEELGDEELIDKLNEIIAVLKRRKKYPYPEEKKQEEEMQGIKKEIKELKEKLNEPDSKTVNLSGTAAKTDPYTGMAQFLLNKGGGEFTI